MPASWLWRSTHTRWLWSQASSAARGCTPRLRPSRPARRGASEFACGTLPLCPPLSAAPAAPSAPPRPLMRRPNPAQTLPKPVVGHLPGQQGDAHRRRPLCAAARPHARRQHPSGAPRAAGQGRVLPPNPESVPPAPRLCAPAWRKGGLPADRRIASTAPSSSASKACPRTDCAASSSPLPAAPSATGQRRICPRREGPTACA